MSSSSPLVAIDKLGHRERATAGEGSRRRRGHAREGSPPREEEERHGGTTGGEGAHLARGGRSWTPSSSQPRACGGSPVAAGSFGGPVAAL